MIDGRRRRAASEGSASGRHFGIGAGLASIGVSADAITALGIVLAGVTGVLIGMGHLWTAVVLLIVGGLMDTLDGVVAKAAGTSSVRGAFFDSVADRVADGLIFGGVAWHLLVGHNPRLALLPIAILAVSGVISYERAKAESLGLSARGGLMERAERLILLGLALLINVVLVPLLIALLVLSCCTAMGRFLRVWRQADRPVPTIRPARVLRPGRVESRWRTWRETGQTGGTRRSQRGRRQREPLSTRVRQVLSSERPSSARRGAATRRSARAMHRRMNDDR